MLISDFNETTVLISVLRIERYSLCCFCITEPIIMNQSYEANCPELEDQLKEKLDQYHQAEAEGKSRVELSLLYRELKELNYKLTSTKARRFSPGA